MRSLVLLAFGFVGTLAQAQTKPLDAVYVLVQSTDEQMMNCPRSMGLKSNSMETGDFVTDAFSGIDTQSSAEAKGDENTVISFKKVTVPGKNKYKFVLQTKRSGAANVNLNITLQDSSNLFLDQSLDGEANGPIPICHNAHYVSKGHT
jgi:hypothetical protein